MPKKKKQKGGTDREKNLKNVNYCENAQEVKKKRKG